MISTPLISFVPNSAAQPTDVLRRDNSVREVVAPLKSNLPFQRERGLGSDAERRAQTYPRSYAQQMAYVRQEAGFPGFLRRSTTSSGDAGPSSPATKAAPHNQAASVTTNTATNVTTNGTSNAATSSATSSATNAATSAVTNSAANNLTQAYARAQLQRDDEPLAVRYTQTERATDVMSYDWRRYRNVDMDVRMLERGRRIEAFYHSSYRTNEQFLLGMA